MILSQDFVFNFLYFGFRCIMKWSEFWDTLLVREILVIEPYQLILKSKERGQAYTEVARNVTKALDYVVSQIKRICKNRLEEFFLGIKKLIDLEISRL